MLTQQEKHHYCRQVTLLEIGEEKQTRLKKASIIVVGMGGLGCPIAQYLVAAGVGTITLVDDDCIEATNLHRQVLYNYDELGISKVATAKQKLERLNPFVKVNALHDRLTNDNIVEILRDCDLAIDGSDNFQTKYLINDACVMLDKPWVFGSIHKFQGQVSVFNYKGGPTYRCVFPEPSELASCSDIGVIGVLPGIIGSLMANETIKLLAGLGNTLTGKLLVFDTLQMNFKIHHIKPIARNKEIKSLIPTTTLCSINTVKFTELMQKDLLIDVRSEEEHKKENIGGILISLHALEANIKNIKEMQKENQRIVFYCKTGKRSSTAVSMALRHGCQKVFSLEGGLDLGAI